MCNVTGSNCVVWAGLTESNWVVCRSIAEPKRVVFNIQKEHTPEEWTWIFCEHEQTLLYKECHHVCHWGQGRSEESYQTMYMFTILRSYHPDDLFHCQYPLPCSFVSESLQRVYPNLDLVLQSVAKETFYLQSKSQWKTNTKCKRIKHTCTAANKCE